MAYLRREKELVEMDYSIAKVWAAIPKAVAALEWTVEENDEANHQFKTKTKANFMAYASVLTINIAASKVNATKVWISAETPVTTITGIVDFGRTRERIDSFLLAMIKQLKTETPSSENSQ